MSILKLIIAQILKRLGEHSFSKKKNDVENKSRPFHKYSFKFSHKETDFIKLFKKNVSFSQSKILGNVRQR